MANRRQFLQLAAGVVVLPFVPVPVPLWGAQYATDAETDAQFISRLIDHIAQANNIPAHVLRTPPKIYGKSHSQVCLEAVEAWREATNPKIVTAWVDPERYRKD